MKKALIILLVLLNCNISMQSENYFSKESKSNDFPQFFIDDTLFILTNGPAKNKTGSNYSLKNSITNEGINLGINSNITIAKASSAEAPIVMAIQSNNEVYNTVGTSDLYIINSFDDIENRKRILSTSSSYNNMMPAYSACGNVLFFASDRPGGEGGLDIWYSIRDEYGYFHKAQNLEVLNTPGDEITPHCGVDGKFYFASNWKDTIVGTDFDIFSATYRKGERVLKPMKSSPLSAINTPNNEVFPFIDPNSPNTILYSSDYKRLYSLKKADLEKTNYIFHVDGTGGAPAYWLKDKTESVYHEVTTDRDIYLEKDHSYQVIVPEYVCEDCSLIPDIKWEFNITKDTVIKRQMPLRNQSKLRKSLALENTNENKLFMQGYWLPLTKKSMKDFRQKEREGFFRNSSFVDSSKFDYAHQLEMCEQLWANTSQNIAEYLEAFSTYCTNTDKLYISVIVYTGEDKIVKYKAPYRDYKGYIYPGDTINLDGIGILPTGLKLDKGSWKVDGEKYSLNRSKQGGNLLISTIRAFYCKDLLDSLLTQYSPIYSYLKSTDQIEFSYLGMGSKKKFAQEKIEIRLANNRIHLLDKNDKLFSFVDSEYMNTTDPVVSKNTKKATQHKTYNDDGTYSMIGNPVAVTPTISSGATVVAVLPPTVAQTDGTRLIQEPNVKQAKPSTFTERRSSKRFKSPEVYLLSQKHKKDTPIKNKEYFYLEIKEYSNKAEADADLKLMRTRGVSKCYIKMAYDFWGNNKYIISSPHFNSEKEAVTFKKSIKFAISTITNEILHVRKYGKKK